MNLVINHIFVKQNAAMSVLHLKCIIGAATLRAVVPKYKS